MRPTGPREPWEGRRVVLGVTGGIAAYKVVQVARDLTRLGAEVDVVMSRAAREFVRPLSFEGVTGRPVLTEAFSAEGAAVHIRLGRDADAVCVAPATADLLARAAQGRSNDLLTTTLLVARCPVLLCPAMNDRMWAHPAVLDNARRCRDLGYVLVGPDSGPLAVGEADGPGRLSEPHEIVARVGRALGADGPLAGRRVLVTAGPTREPIDPVRYVGNRSSGRMGFAIAESAWLAGAQVTLVTGPSALDDPAGVETIRVDTGRQMFDAVRPRVGEADVVVYAAAVADFRPADPAAEKLKRREMEGPPTVAFAENPDIARETLGLRREGAVAVGFALETSDLLARAEAKRIEKGFDLLVANDATEAGAGFEVETNRVTLLEAGREPLPLPILPKPIVADRILARAAALLRSGVGSS
ncbi:MAG: bifunctional phosphopantothenoylcysteine decarboxylase/phosphopantothenate--cysteine ligase CoaBC [Gemmatimonadetes bacterium]|nr:bifunctional phosphopantothenoylcysteine decarboxylase/phosphopantothenate--cysteine ligase CoaBC [Gemmatimonadota bacterium]